MSPTAPPIDVRTEVVQLIRTGNVRKASAVLGVSREALARICGGLPVRPGTIALIRQNLPRTPSAALVNQVYKRPSAIGTGGSLCPTPKTPTPRGRAVARETTQ